LPLEQSGEGLYDDVAITQEERTAVAPARECRLKDGAACAIDLCPETSSERTVTRVDAVMCVGRRWAWVLYLMMAAVVSLSMIPGVAAAKDAADHQSVVWGTQIRKTASRRIEDVAALAGESDIAGAL
jgi:hypothetical protein